jgi:hypothetical protein
MVKRLKNLILLSILFVLLAGCRSVSNGSATLTQPPTTPATDLPTDLPKPAADKGAMKGTLVYETADGKLQPYGGLRLYLGILIKSDDGKVTLARVNDKTAPQTFTDEQGKFVFTDLEPRDYIIAVEVPPHDLLKLKDPKTGNDILYTIKGGEITDVGNLAQDLPWFLTPSP